MEKTRTSCLRVFSFLPHFDNHVRCGTDHIIHTHFNCFNEDNTILLEKYLDNLLSENLNLSCWEIILCQDKIHEIWPIKTKETEPVEWSKKTIWKVSKCTPGINWMWTQRKYISITKQQITKVNCFVFYSIYI